MTGITDIEWADYVWNPVTGCSKVSEGCRNCYAEALSLRFGRSVGPWNAANAEQNVILHPDRLDQIARLKKPGRVFVNSMSDLFHELVPFAFIQQVWQAMQRAEHLTFLVLTKRASRMRELLSPYPYLGNVWLGVSVEDQRAADERIHHLMLTPAKARFLSCEPLLGPIDLHPYASLHLRCEHGRIAEEPDTFVDGCGCYPSLPVLDWVISGGESGPRHRPMDLSWARSLRDQCAAGGVAFFHKQNGGRTPKAGGRLLDGREHNDMPAVAAGAAL